MRRRPIGALTDRQVLADLVNVLRREASRTGGVRGGRGRGGGMRIGTWDIEVDEQGRLWGTHPDGQRVRVRDGEDWGDEE